MFQNKKYTAIVLISWLVIVALAGGYLWHLRSVRASELDRVEPSQTTSSALVPAMNGSAHQPAQSIGAATNANGAQISSDPVTPTSVAADTSAASYLNPATFSQYDTYKTDANTVFRDLQIGEGAVVTAGKKVTVLYRGWLTNGQLFDESRTGSDGKMEAYSFTQGAHSVIPGWEQGLEGMKTGGVRLLIVPPSVGYGAAGQGTIPSNAVLVFQVQLVSVE